MKPRHQIDFKRRNTTKTRVISEAKGNVRPLEKKAEIVSAQVQFGERELRFARALSDTEKKVRDASMNSLREWLSENAADMNETQLDHLWKGLFYCVWMADKRHVITAVNQSIVDLTDVAGWPFLEASFVCLMREWFGIDRHRIDKYYELVTAVLKKCMSKFVSEKSSETVLEGLAHFLFVLRTKVWDASVKWGIGLALHILDVYIDTVMLPVFINARQIELSDAVLFKIYHMLLDDVMKLMGGKDSLTGVSRRIQTRIVDRLIELVSNPQLGFKKQMQCTMITRISKRLFTIASDKRTVGIGRKELYESGIKLKVFVNECEVDDDNTDMNDGESEEIDDEDDDDEEMPDIEMAPALDTDQKQGKSASGGNKPVTQPKNDAENDAAVKERKSQGKKQKTKSVKPVQKKPARAVNGSAKSKKNATTATVKGASGTGVKHVGSGKKGGQKETKTKRKVDNGLTRARKRLRKGSETDRA